MATNVQIPIDNAGIGDAIAIKNNTTGEDKSHFICVVGSTVSATAPTGYTWYGSVYGREKGGLMIRSFKPTTAKWASTTADGEVIGTGNNGSLASSHPNVHATTTPNGGNMRNGNGGLWGYILGMSVGEVISRNNVSDNSSTALHPTSPFKGNGSWPMNKATFDLDTNKAKTIYGTYENYVAQTLPIMKGGQSGVFSKRYGKLNTKEMATKTAETTGHSFPAAQYCYKLKITTSENANHWWLPDMYELAVMMSDNSFDKCQYVHSVIGDNTSRAVSRWSSVRYGDTSAWGYYYYGFSGNYDFSYGFTVCPVTLLAL